MLFFDMIAKKHNKMTIYAVLKFYVKQLLTLYYRVESVLSHIKMKNIVAGKLLYAISV
jgi:tRNA(Phe) wybutosine-synthesizing methylase Tyw3